jgi:hypothetical protein
MDPIDHANIIRPIIDEADVDAEQVLAALVDLLVRDHLIARAKANTTAINHPTTLWNIEKLIADRMRRQNEALAGNAGGPIDPLLGLLTMLLVTCRERAEDQARRARGEPPRDDGDDEPPRMRLVRD